jgi:major membrane immunogen (membrane-anchored lipoprotein)
MKNLLKIAMVFIMVASVASFAFAGGEGESEGAGGFQDGVYFAQQDAFGDTGWKYMVTIEVKDGKIVSAEWDGANVNAGPDKITLSKSGQYGMVANGGAQAEWYVQAQKTSDYLVKVQDPAQIRYNKDDGTTDAISGVSIHINDFVELAEQALKQGPVGYGPYKDGSYHAEAPEFEHGYKDAVDLTVVSGRIVAVHWAPIAEDGGVTKNEASEAGDYGMFENGGAQDPWYVQADRAEAALLKSQDPKAIPFNDDGYTDAISGVSIHVNEFLGLAEKALEGAK